MLQSRTCLIKRSSLGIIEETFKVKTMRLEHHFIDNQSLEDDPIGKHFGDWAIADLLSSLIDETGQATSGVQYPN